MLRLFALHYVVVMPVCRLDLCVARGHGGKGRPPPPKTGESGLSSKALSFSLSWSRPRRQYIVQVYMQMYSVYLDYDCVYSICLPGGLATLIRP